MDYGLQLQKESQSQQLACSPGMYIRPTRRQQLQDQRAMLTKQLEVVDDAIAALDAHPELEKFAEALSRAGV